jgi:hypothetical protein
MGPWRAVMLIMKARRLRVEPRRAYRPVIADRNHFDEKQDPDPIKVKIGSALK